jgi:hypothetical protein
MNLRVLKQRFATTANDARNAHTAHIAAAAVVVACRRRSSKGNVESLRFTNANIAKAAS